MNSKEKSLKNKSTLKEITHQKYMISEMPVNFDSIKFCDDTAILKRLELLDVYHFALAVKYGSSQLYKVSLDSLETILLCETDVADAYWFCAKLMPRWGYGYDWVIAWERNANQIYRISTNGNVISALANQNWGWLQNTGFDWIPTSSGYADSTWMYAEYIVTDYTGYNDVTTLKVWRSTDAGATWTEVFSKNTRNHTTPEIYHFHIVKHDPYNEGHWYLSSGDEASESFIWRSIDDGLTWTDVSDITYTGEKQKIHRTTNMYFTEDAIYWGLDDYIYEDEIGSAWVRADRNVGGRLMITPLADLGNWVRNVTKTPYGLVILTENRPTDTSNALVWLIPYDDLTHPILIGKTEGCSYNAQICDNSYGSRIFLGFSTRTYPLYIMPSMPGFNLMEIHRGV